MQDHVRDLIATVSEAEPALLALGDGWRSQALSHQP
jgi:hypothetical protein